MGKKAQRVRGSQEDGWKSAQKVEGKDLKFEGLGSKKAPSFWEGQLCDLSEAASLSQQVFTPTFGSQVFIGKIEHLRFH